MIESNNNPIFSALIEENEKLRAEITEVNRYQFQITSAVSLGVIGGLSTWFGFLQCHPEILIIIAGLSLIQILISLEFRFRIKALNHRI